ncbi:MAG: MarR family transcriptional regulator [Sporolactobacillus sp.]
MDNRDRDAIIETIGSTFQIVIRRFKKSIQTLPDSTITAHEYAFLACLLNEQQRTASGLAKQFEVTPSYATMVVDKLIRNGFLSRHRSTSDRRIVELTVTDKGSQTLDKIGVERRTILRDIFGKLDDDQLTSLAQLVAILAEE